MPTTWDDAKKVHLLMTMMEVGDVVGKWDLIATKMGPAYTREGVRGIYKIIKAKRDKEFGASAEFNTTTPKTTTSKTAARKRRQPSEAAKDTPSKKSKSKGKAEPVEEEDDEEEGADIKGEVED